MKEQNLYVILLGIAVVIMIASVLYLLLQPKTIVKEVSPVLMVNPVEQAELYTSIPIIMHAEYLNDFYRENNDSVNDFYNNMCREVNYVDDAMVNALFEMDMKGELNPPLTSLQIKMIKKLEEFAKYCVSEMK